jgi:hypothetical protein
VPVLKATGDDIDEGEAMRYLSELPWVPHALEANRQLGGGGRPSPSRSPLIARVYRGSARVRRRRRHRRNVRRARPRREGKTSVPTPWGGRFSDYRELGGFASRRARRCTGAAGRTVHLLARHDPSLELVS